MQQKFTGPMMDETRKYMYVHPCFTNADWCDKCDSECSFCRCHDCDDVYLCSYAFEVLWVVGDVYRRRVDHETERRETEVPDDLVPWREEFTK